MNPFEQLGVSPKVAEAIAELGFVSPMPIQEQAIPVLLKGDCDFVGLAQTGTGKTAAFGLPLLELIDISQRHPQGLILCPTRELCLQITKDLQNYGKNLGNDLNVVAVYGGASIINQLKDIKRGAQIIVATPGRMLDVLNRKAIDFSNVHYVVLDEADEMLNMGFQDDINDILATTPDEKFTWLFSATMPAEVRRIAQKYMNDPKELTIGSKNTGNVNIEHEYYIAKARDKYATLKRLVDFNPDIFGIVFSRTKIETQEIAEALIRDGYDADSLHGDLSQQQRDKVMKRFRDKSLQLLIATDVAARGIDVDSVTHVINYSLPDELENYTHRSGRTARAGKTGISMAIINSKEVGKIRQIERVIGKKFVKAEIPGGFDVCEKQLFSLVHKVNNVVVNEEQIDQYLPRIFDEFKDISKEDIIKKFASIEFNRFLEYYKNAPDLNAKAEDRGERGERGDSFPRDGARGDYTRYFINLGSVDDITRGDMLGLICDKSGIAGAKVGKIDIKGVYSFFEVDNSEAEKVNTGFKDAVYRGRNVRIELSESKGGGGERREGRGGYGGGERREGGGGYGGGGGYRGGGNRREGGSGGGYGGGGRREGTSSGGYGGPKREGSGYGGNRDSSVKREGSSSGSSRPRREGGSKEGGRGGKW